MTKARIVSTVEVPLFCCCCFKVPMDSQFIQIFIKNKKRPVPQMTLTCHSHFNVFAPTCSPSTCISHVKNKNKITPIKLQRAALLMDYGIGEMNWLCNKSQL